MSKQSEKEFFNDTYDSNARRSVGQIYSIIRTRVRCYEDLIYSGVEGLKILEYGCGEGSHSLEMARRGGQVVGIDISEVGIVNATARAKEKGIVGVEYKVMDAEKMTFSENTFDLVIGEGILHHLDLEQSYREISRVLKPDGRAIFMEPLGHNPAIEGFRKFTPKLRTADEHPLVYRDFKLAESFFGKTDFRFFHLTSFMALALLKTPLFFRAVDWLDKVDAVLFKVIPPIKWMSWYSIMVMSEPHKDASAQG